MSETDINATVNVTEDIYADVDSTAMSAAVIDDGDSIVVPAEVDFGQTLDTELEDNDLIDVPVDESVGIAGDHRVLLHRDAPNQHPMSSITGLNDTIAGINTALSDRISQVEAETAELDVDMAGALLRIGDLQDQVDGNITTWFYAAEPAMNLPPVTVDPSNPHDTGWDTDDKKNEHKGDLYYNTLTGYAYRFAYSDGAYGWLRITDTDVVKALADAARAQDTADSKRRVFYATPTPPYDKGDLWVQGGSGDILVCSTDKPAGGSYSVSDWSLASKYTDDTVADMALASANGKNTVYHQASQPTGGTYKQGDTWFDTDDDFTMYTYDGALWIKEQFGNEALADLSVTNAKIANATIEYGKIKSVDAGKITVGYLNADRIEAGSIGTSKIAAGAITADKIQARSIGASQIAISDSTNLAVANESYAGSLPTNVVDTYKAEIRDGYLTKKTATQQYLMLTDYTPNGFQTNDELYFEFYGKAEVAGSVRIGTWCYNKSGSSYANAGSNYKALDFTTTEQFFSGTITLADADWSTANAYLLGFDDRRTTKSQIYIRKCVIRRKSGGNLIVDGAITTDKLDAGAVTTAKLDAGAVTADKIGAGAVTTAKLDANAVTADKINAGAVTTAKLDASAVTADKIATNAVTAGKIASGAVTADKIEANAITLGKISSSAQAEILNSNVLVGGRNLLLNTATERVSPASADGSAYPAPSPILSDYGFSIMNNEDDYWTYSLDYKVTGNSAEGAYFYVQVKGSQASVPTTRGQYVINKPIGHFVHTFKLNATQVASTATGCRIRLRDATDGAILTVSNLKLEKGNKETDWTPAPEDSTGARNLFKAFPYVNNQNITRVTYTYNSSTGLYKLTTTETGDNFKQIYTNDAVTDVASIKGKTCTLSATSITSSRAAANPRVYLYGKKTDNTTYTGVCLTKDKLSAQVTIPSDVSTLGYLIRCDQDKGEAVGEIAQFKGLKLEVGSTPTPWTPAVEDATSKYITYIDDNGIRVHPAATKNNAVVINSDGMEVFKGNVSVAQYGDSARIGKDTDSHIAMDYHSLQLLDKEGNTYFHVSDLRNTAGKATVYDNFTGNGSTKTFELTLTPVASSITVKVNGSTVTAFTASSSYLTFTTAPANKAKIVVSYQTTSKDAKVFTFGNRRSGNVGAKSIAMGQSNLASAAYSAAIGDYNEASGNWSFAEGLNTTASGSYSHAEGGSTVASSNGAHAEGQGTTASGSSSHAEGYETTASGSYSHAGGYYTTAGSDYQTVIGKYNSNNSSNVFEIGYGSSSSPENIFEVDEYGCVNVACSINAYPSYKVDGAVVASARKKTTITPTAASGASNYSSYGNSYYEKAGNIVHVHIGVSGLTTGTATSIYTLPSGHRPTSKVFAHGTGGAWNNLGYMEITTAGVITVRSEGTYCGADVTYFV